MRVFSTLFALAVIVAVVSAVSEPKLECHHESLDLTLQPGEINYPEGECMQVACSEAGELKTTPCEFVIGLGCKVVMGDPSKQFPSCCPTVECPK